MNNHRVILTTVLTVLFLGVQTPQFAQDTSGPVKPDKAKRWVAIDLLRAINTAEVTYRQKNGSFTEWQSLLSSEPKYFGQFLAKYGPDQRDRAIQMANPHFLDPPQIWPGWNLRLNVHPDGQGYDVLLRDMTDEKCSYAALTDEGGVIRQSKAIDCEI